MVEVPGYLIEGTLGSGGMATVYLAVQQSLDRKVALKVLKLPNDADRERNEKRFMREARTLARLNHRNICAIYDIGQAGDCVYLAMEYLDGGTLSDRIRRGLSLGEAISITVQIAAGLNQAHAQGIVHRDLKPSNVMMRGEVPVLTDFGVARQLGAQTQITADNMVIGTPIYMSPEQVQGGEVDGRADLYALGIVMHELITGAPPYRGDTALAVCMQHITAQLPVLPEHLHSLQAVLNRLLAKSAEERYPNAEAFISALKQLVLENYELKHTLSLDCHGSTTEQLRALGFSLEASRTDLQPVPAPTVRRKPAVADSGAQAPRSTAHAIGWIAGVVLVCAAMIGGAWYFSSQPSAAHQTALNALAREFDGFANGDMLFLPKERNAARVLEEMRGLPSAPITRSREEALILAIRRMARDALARDDEAAVRDLVAQASKVLNADDQATLAKMLADTRIQALRNEDAAALITRLNSFLATPPPTLDPVYAAITRLQEISGSNDQRRMQLELRVAQLAAERITERFEQGDVASAEVFIAALQSAIPSAPITADLRKQLVDLKSPLRRQEAQRALELALLKPNFGKDDLRPLLREWQLLAPNDPNRALLGPRLRDKVQPWLKELDQTAEDRRLQRALRQAFS